MTLACISQVIDICKNSTCAAMVLVAAGMVIGVVAVCVGCKLFGPCGKGGCKCDTKKPANKPYEKVATRHPAPADGSIEIYVGNLSYDLTEDQLRKEFEAYGKVNSARIITNRYNNKSKGFGFVHMPNRAEADAAVAALNDKDILGRKLKCNEARNVG